MEREGRLCGGVDVGREREQRRGEELTGISVDRIVKYTAKGNQLLPFFLSFWYTTFTNMCERTKFCFAAYSDNV